MNMKEANELGNQIAELVETHEVIKAYSLLAPILSRRTPFPRSGRIGEIVGRGSMPAANAFLERIAEGQTEGGWVVIGCALGQQLDRDPAGTFARCRGYIIAADVWYGADILGERLPGPALLVDFQPALALLAPWREDGNRWVRRAVGVSVHFWAKRSRGRSELAPQAASLLAFLEPMFTERSIDAVKGVGWGLKTLGKHYPDLMTDWLAEQVARHQGQYRALMLRKAITYLSPEQRQGLGIGGDDLRSYGAGDTLLMY
ncbi:MAG: DNA alkylation repair protein [Anaerolineae bacterium]|nr:DNA alkylation repair protein [Anaerolineae bacterium]